MLQDAAVTTILPVRNMDRARDFYAGPLGLRPEGERPDGKFVFRFGSGGLLALFEKPDARPSPTTALSFAVDDIEQAVGALEQRGVHFEDYDLPGLRTVNHVCLLGAEKAAWFTDTEGNILCLHQDVSPA